MMPIMLSSVSGRTRPGIRFETMTPLLPEAMQRMDVAAFIGFAERGPLHCPVAIEDIAQFETVFGVTPRLGWAAKGERLSGHLAESVRAFFIQGGRRCWVVRVASATATSNQFILPGLYRVTPSSSGLLVLPALVQARCEGGWSDRLRVATRLQVRSFTYESISAIAPGQGWVIRTRSDFVRPGDLVRIVSVAGTQQIFIPISSVEHDAASGELILHAKTVAVFAKCTPDEVKVHDCVWKQIAIGEPSSWSKGRAAVVSIDLRVRDEKSSQWRAENLGLTPLHPRYCGALPTDLDVYQGTAPGAGASIQSDSSRPITEAWLPLAGIAQRVEDSATTFLVPLEIDGNFGTESSANPQLTPQLERDGLANFDASLFLDATLRETRIAELMAIANTVRYSDPKPRPLQGIHAVLGWFGSTIQDEVTLIAVPDAVHAPWRGRPQPLRYSYVVENILPKVNTDVPVPFTCCDELATPTNLTVKTTTETGIVIRLGWEMPKNTSGAEIEYIVQESVTENFKVADMQWQTRETYQEIAIIAPDRSIFRVRAMSGNNTSAWSLPIALRIRETEAAGEPGSTPGEIAREIHRALIRLCAAQGELFSVLALPRDTTEQDAVNHVRALSVAEGKLAGLNCDSEGRVGSYAAIYHPWLETRSATGIVRPLPPDGAVLGMFAARARDRGAWVAPANRALLGVVALHSVIPDSRQAVLLDAGINLVLHRPEGYTLLSEETLSSVPDLRAIHVRRLLILLRRMMLRMGEEFTFETHNQILRDLVRQRCVNLLERMFRSGAFAGRSTEEAFQVSVDYADNTVASIDAGRLIVKVRIRPAQALRFITIRFALGGAAGVTEENAT